MIVNAFVWCDAHKMITERSIYIYFNLFLLLAWGLTSHMIKDIVRTAKIYKNENRVEVTRKVPMDGKLLLDEESR